MKLSITRLCLRLVVAVVWFSKWPFATGLSSSFTKQPFALKLPNDANNNVKMDTTILDDKDGTLASLFGSKENRDLFFSHYYGTKRPIHIHRSQVELEFDAIQQGNNKKNLLQELFETCPYVTLRQHGQPKSLDEAMTFCEFQDAITNGCSAVIPVVQQPSFQPLRKSLEESFQKSVSMTIYHSGPNASALLPHTDSYDVFVIQLEGCKDWEIVQGYKETRRATTFTLKPGDLLYIPYNVIHSATTTQGFDYSTHLTIGLLHKWKPQDTLNYSNSINNNGKQS